MEVFMKLMLQRDVQKPPTCGLWCVEWSNDSICSEICYWKHLSTSQLFNLGSCCFHTLSGFCHLVGQHSWFGKKSKPMQVFQLFQSLCSDTNNAEDIWFAQGFFHLYKLSLSWISFIFNFHYLSTDLRTLTPSFLIQALFLDRGLKQNST